MKLIHSKAVFDKYQKLIRFANSLIIKNSYLADSFETEKTLIADSKITTLKLSNYSMPPEEQLQFILYLEELKKNFIKDVEYFAKTAETSYYKCSPTLSPGTLDGLEIGTFRAFVREGKIYQQDLYKQVTLTDILNLGKSYCYDKDYNKVSVKSLNYATDKDKEFYILQATSSKFNLLNGKEEDNYNITQFENYDMSELGEDVLQKIEKNHYPYYYKVIYFYNANTGNYENVSDRFSDEIMIGETPNVKDIIGELWGTPKIHRLFLNTSTEVGNYEGIANASSVIRQYRADEGYQKFSDFVQFINNTWTNNNHKFDRFYINHAGEYLQISLEYLYENIFMPLNDEDILVTNVNGEPIYSTESPTIPLTFADDEGKALFIFNRLYGTQDFHDISSLSLEEISNVMELYLRITMPCINNVYNDEQDVYYLPPYMNRNIDNSSNDYLFSAVGFFEYLYSYFYNMPSENFHVLDNNDDILRRESDISIPCNLYYVGNEDVDLTILNDTNVAKSCPALFSYEDEDTGLVWEVYCIELVWNIENKYYDVYGYVRTYDDVAEDYEYASASILLSDHFEITYNDENKLYSILINSEEGDIEGQDLYVDDLNVKEYFYFTVNSVYYGYLVDSKEYNGLDIKLIDTIIPKYALHNYYTKGSMLDTSTINNQGLLNCSYIYVKEPVLPKVLGLQGKLLLYGVNKLTNKRLYVDIFSVEYLANGLITIITADGDEFTNDINGTPNSINKLYRQSLNTFPIINTTLFPKEENEYYTAYRRIGVDIVTSRVLPDRSIIKYDNSILNNSEFKQFLDCYVTSSKYFMSIFYNKTYELYPNYQGLVNILILFSTIQRYLNLDSQYNLNYDLMSLHEVENLFASYGITGIHAIPTEYRSKLLTNINSLFKKKGTDAAFLDILNIFEIDDINIYKYILVKYSNFDRRNNCYEIDKTYYPHELNERIITNNVTGVSTSYTEEEYPAFSVALQNILNEREANFDKEDIFLLKNKLKKYFSAKVINFSEWDEEIGNYVENVPSLVKWEDIETAYKEYFQYKYPTITELEQEMNRNLGQTLDDAFKAKLTAYLVPVNLADLKLYCLNIGLDFHEVLRTFYVNLFLEKKKALYTQSDTITSEEIVKNKIEQKISMVYDDHNFSFPYRQFAIFLFSLILNEYTKRLVDTKDDLQKIYLMFREEGFPINKTFSVGKEVTTKDLDLIKKTFMSYITIKYSLENIAKRFLLKESDYIKEKNLKNDLVDGNGLSLSPIERPIKPQKPVNDKEIRIPQYNPDDEIPLYDWNHGQFIPISGGQSNGATDGEGSGGGNTGGGNDNQDPGNPDNPIDPTDPPADPLAPTLENIVCLTANSIIATWNSVPNATMGYNLQVSTNNFATAQNIEVLVGTSWTVTGLLNIYQTTYKVRVRAKIGIGQTGAWSNIRTVSPPVVGIPTLSEPASVNQTYFNLFWTAVDNATTYEIGLSTNENHTGEIIANTNNNKLAAVITGVTPNTTTYYVRVRAKVDTMTGVWSSTKQTVYNPDGSGDEEGDPIDVADFAEEMDTILTDLNGVVESVQNQIPLLANESLDILRASVSGLGEFLSLNRRNLEEVIENIADEIDDALRIKKELAEAAIKALQEREIWKSYYNELKNVLHTLVPDFLPLLISRLISNLDSLFLSSIQDYTYDFLRLQILSLLTPVIPPRSQEDYIKKVESDTELTLQRLEYSALYSGYYEFRVRRFCTELDVSLFGRDGIEKKISMFVKMVDELQSIEVGSVLVDGIILEYYKKVFVDTAASMIDTDIINLAHGILSVENDDTYPYDTMTTLTLLRYLVDLLNIQDTYKQLSLRLVQRVIETNPGNSKKYSLKFLKVPIQQKNIEEVVAGAELHEYIDFADFVASDPLWRATKEEIFDSTAVNDKFNYLATKYYSIENELYSLTRSEQFTMLFGMLNMYTTNIGGNPDHLTLRAGAISDNPVHLLDMVFAMLYTTFRIYGMSSVAINFSNSTDTLSYFKEDTDVYKIYLDEYRNGNDPDEDTGHNVESYPTIPDFLSIVLKDTGEDPNPTEKAITNLIMHFRRQYGIKTDFEKLILATRNYNQYRAALDEYHSRYSGKVSSVFEYCDGYTTYDALVADKIPGFIEWLEQDLTYENNNSAYYQQKFFTLYNYVLDYIEDREFAKLFKTPVLYDAIKKILLQLMMIFKSYTITIKDIASTLIIDKMIENHVRSFDQILNCKTMDIRDINNKFEYLVDGREKEQGIKDTFSFDEKLEIEISGT